MGKPLNATLGNLGCILYTVVSQAEVLWNPGAGES